LPGLDQPKVGVFVSGGIDSALLYYLLMKLNAEFYITDSWSTRNPKGSQHILHNHEHSIFSGVYYIDASSGSLEFEVTPQYNKDFKLNYNITEWNTWNSRSWKVETKPGMLVIFPSWVWHSVTPNLNEKDRRIIGWNCFVRGKFGSDALIDNVTIR
jgi:uncharacterized protein (TIGR02466 family)